MPQRLARLDRMISTHIGTGPYPACMVDECPWCASLERAHRPPRENAPRRKKPWEHEQLLDWKCSHHGCTLPPFMACGIKECPMLVCRKPALSDPLARSPHESCPTHPLGSPSNPFFAPPQCGLTPIWQACAAKLVVLVCEQLIESRLITLEMLTVIPPYSHQY